MYCLLNNKGFLKIIALNLLMIICIKEWKLNLKVGDILNVMTTIDKLEFFLEIFFGYTHFHS